MVVSPSASRMYPSAVPSRWGPDGAAGAPDQADDAYSQEDGLRGSLPTGLSGGDRLIQGSQGANTSGNGNLYEDYKVGLVGLAFLDKAIKITEIKFQIGDRKYPRVNIEEAYAYENPAIIFEDYFIIDEEELILNLDKSRQSKRNIGRNIIPSERVR